MSRSTVRRMVKMEGLPFTPMEKGNVEWFFSCSKLTESGRCGIYEDRPEVCRKYIASTEICHPGASDVIIVSDRLLDPVQQENILT
jgi:Fe-S-cluster containining protein